MRSHMWKAAKRLIWLTWCAWTGVHLITTINALPSNRQPGTLISMAVTALSIMCLVMLVPKGEQ